MVYHGAVSKGCQRCRQRKVKCDQRKPACLKCEKLKKECPGYRDLTDVMFRDESDRIIWKTKTARQPPRSTRPKARPTPTPEPERVPEPEPESHALILLSSTPAASSLEPVQSPSPSPPPVFEPESVPYAISPSIHELAANFFFANYNPRGPPYSDKYHNWLTREYWDARPDHILRATIEAVGMAGISNTFHATSLMPKAKEQYGRALTMTNKALRSPIEATTDRTLLAILLLGLVEMINFETWDHYSSWAAHVDGATALLRLRDRQQFYSEPGVQLYIQIRSQIVHACMQQDTPIPEALLRSSDDFENIRDRDRPESIADVSFRLANLRAEIKSGKITDPKAIREAAIQVDKDLKARRTKLHPISRFYSVKAAGVPSEISYNGNCHVYSSDASANVWNNWRALRILANQIIYHYDEDTRDTFENPQDDVDGTIPNPALHPAVSIIRELSTDICISATTMTNSPRSRALIWPLFLVSQETLNTSQVRALAVTQLRHINAATGIRLAGLLADQSTKDFKNTAAGPRWATTSPASRLVALKRG